MRLTLFITIPLVCVAVALAAAGWKSPAPAALRTDPNQPSAILARPVSPVNGWLPNGGNDPRPAFDVRNCPEIARVYDLYPAKDAIPVLLSPTFTTTADALWLDDRAPVLGLKIGAESHCYPLAILNWHSLVHDSLGGQGVYIFFDPPSGLAIARRTLAKSRPMGLAGYGYDGVGLTYEASSGRLYDMLGGTWLSATPNAATGFGSGDCDWLPLERMTWGQWRALHGNTTVLSRDTGQAFDYSFDPYSAAALGPGGAVENYWTSDTLLAPKSLRDAQQTLPDKSFVLAFLAGAPGTPAGQREPWAVPLDALAGDRRELTVTTAAGKVTVYADPANDRYYAEDEGGHWLPQVRMFWYAWKTRFPGTKVYQKQEAIETDE